MATYNGGKFIREQVDSILNQEFTENEGVEIELVVSDDGSTDDTIQILESYHDPRIKIFMHQNKKEHKYLNANRKASENFENALMKAKGDYLFFSDQDDVWMPWKLDKSLSVLRKFGGDCLKTHSIKKRLRLFYIINTVSLVISKNFRNFIAV